MTDNGAQAVVSDAGAAAGEFVHLHLHTEYSLLDGGNRVDRLVARVKELGMTAVGVTDHGNLFGAVAVYEACRGAGIKPILGVEAYVAPGDRTDRTFTGVSDGGYHLVLLAENLTGWRNLLHLCSEAYVSGFYFKPRVDRQILAEHAQGLIAINGHLGSEIGEHLLAYEQTGEGKWWERAVESARWHAAAFASAGIRGSRDQGIKAERGEPTAGSADPLIPGSLPRFYIELQHHVQAQNSINKHLIRLARELGLPLVCDNDAHFLRAEDHDAHDTLVCISMGKVKTDESRLRYPEELYVKSARQMRELFEREYGDVGREACDNTVRIADRCNVELPLGVSHAPLVRVRLPAKGDLPRADDPAFGGDLTAWYRAYCGTFEVVPFDASKGGVDAAQAKRECDEALRMLAEGGFVWRYGVGAQDGEKRARLERELRILCDKGIAAYFLIVWDFVNWGRQRGIPAMARGSGVGTMVGYVLGLSNACPVRYGLLFERFTDPDRSEYPDIDIDLCQDGRGAVIDYVRRKYGHVAQIITFGTLKARAAVRDVGRVLQMPLSEVDALAKMIPEALGMTLDQALDQEPDLRRLYEQKPEVRRVINTARTLEGQARHASVHAAGVIVATQPLSQIVPLYKQSGSGEHEIVTQWDGPTCEKMGLLKMDFLGLRTLSVIERVKGLIREGLGEGEIWKAVGRDRGTEGQRDQGIGPHPLDLDRLAFDDQRVFEMFARGDATGVFQFESGGMRRLLVEMRPDRLEDLIAANALFRPGPMDLIPDYNRRKHGQDAAPAVHPLVDKYTAETYGVMVYQEQVMQIVHELGGIPLRAAYSLIKAISKKKEKEINAERGRFVQGAVTQGLSEAKAEDLFELILKFAGYGFNKSHSTGYAIVAYQTAYLKTYFPNQYMAAFLTYESGAQKVSDWAPYLEDCKRTRFVDGRIGVEVRPPDVNLSQADFSVVFVEGEPRDALHGHVRFGLKGVKGVGEKAIEAIVEERDRGIEGSGDRGEGEARHKGAEAQRHRGEEGKGRRPYTSLFDFCERVLARAGTGSGGAVVNKATIEALIKSGAMDCLHGRESRAAMCATIEAAMTAGQRAAADKVAGQGGLWGEGIKGSEDRGIEGVSGVAAAVGATARAQGALARAAKWDEVQTLAYEKETIGLYVSSHPLDKWGAWAGVFVTATTESIKTARQDARVVMAGLVQGVRPTVVRSGRAAGQKMGVVTLEDAAGTVQAVLFSACYAQFEHLLKADSAVFLLGRVDRSRGEPQVIVERVVPIDGVPLQPGLLRIVVHGARLNGTGAAALEQVARVIGPAGHVAGIRADGVGANGNGAGGGKGGRGGSGGGGGSGDELGAGLEAIGKVVQVTDGGEVGGLAAAGFHGEIDAGAAAFPLQVVVDTGREWVVMAAEGGVRVYLTPRLAEELTRLLGDGCVRVVGGLAVEVAGAGVAVGNGKKWGKRVG